MMPFNFSFRLLLRKFIPQLKEEDLDRHESLFALRNQLRHELNYEPKPNAIGRYDDKSKAKADDTENDYNENDQKPKQKSDHQKRLEDLIEQSTEDAVKIFLPYKPEYEAAHRKWVSRRQHALEQGNLQQIPTSVDGLGRFGKTYLNYRWVQIRTAPRLYWNRTKYHFRKNKLVSAIAVPVVAALIGTSLDAVLAEFQPPKIIPDIKGQVIKEGQKFLEIDLGNHVSDPNHNDSEINWSTSGQKDLTVRISNGDRRKAEILVPDSKWNGSEIIHFKATNPGGLSDSDTAKFVVEPVNDAPQITSEPVASVESGSAYEYKVNAHDNDKDDRLSYSLIEAPDFMKIDTTTGLISGTPALADTGTFAISILVKDAAGLSNKQNYQITVLPQR